MKKQDNNSLSPFDQERNKEDKTQKIEVKESKVSTIQIKPIIRKKQR